MLQRVWEAAACTEIFDEIAFAIDAPETARLIDSFGGRYFMTSIDCQSGTDRLVELNEAKSLQGDLWVNWQGDEPSIHRAMIEDLLQSVDENAFDIYSLKKEINDRATLEDPNVVKVVTNSDGRALYFSRSPIPYYRDATDFSETPYYKHIGIYAYTEKALNALVTLSPTPLERAEKLEQLRFLENGLSLQVHETLHETHGIDTPEDLAHLMTR